MHARPWPHPRRPYIPFSNSNRYIWPASPGSPPGPLTRVPGSWHCPSCRRWPAWCGSSGTRRPSAKTPSRGWRCRRTAGSTRATTSTLHRVKVPTQADICLQCRTKIGCWFEVKSEVCPKQQGVLSCHPIPPSPRPSSDASMTSLQAFQPIPCETYALSSLVHSKK